VLPFFMFRGLSLACVFLPMMVIKTIFLVIVFFFKIFFRKLNFKF